MWIWWSSGKLIFDPRKSFTKRSFGKKSQLFARWLRGYIRAFLKLYDREPSQVVRDTMLAPGCTGIRVTIYARPEGYEYVQDRFDLPLGLFDRSHVRRAFAVVESHLLEERRGSGVFLAKNLPLSRKSRRNWGGVSLERYFIVDTREPNEVARGRWEFCKKIASDPLGLETALGEQDRNKKGRLLEGVLASIFGSIPGLRVIERNVRTATEEVDLVVRNESTDPFLVQRGPYFLVECKNWSRKKVGKNELVLFERKLENRYGNCSVGFLVAVNGFARTFHTERLRSSRFHRVVAPIDLGNLWKLIRSSSRAEDLKRIYDSAVLELARGRK